MKNPTLRFKGGRIAKVFFILFLFTASSLILNRLPAQAEDWSIIEQIPAERLKPFTVSSTDGSLSFIAGRGTSTDDLSLEIKTLYSQDEISDNFPLSDQLIPASALYSLTLSAASPSSAISDFNPQIVFRSPNDNRLRRFYLWDPLSNAFIAVASQKDLKRQLITYNILDYGTIIFALFEEPVSIGRASWYVHPRYRKELMAASTEFSRGAKVKVTNLDNNKSVIVTIKDWGPDPIKHPDRVIDLNKIAFQKIASTRAGIINVKVEPMIESTSTIAIKNN